MSFGMISNYFVKAGKSIPIHSTLSKFDDYLCEYVDDFLGVVKNTQVKKNNLHPSAETRAKLGDASVWIEAQLGAFLPEAKAEVQLLFGELESVETIMQRSKGALSIYPKLEKELVKAATGSKGGLYSIQEAINAIGDGGYRFIKHRPF